ncbi:hypothetical protein CEXT_244941 [Caerostris extrusa]|uniref:Uncharacterized protein n=1 Tax=Caerostris extrusa TaxID=172846 RepID=A0AAV4V4L4_CAEEX|nr:hypothetical protein CEXT_244941 [Caerostris extrusa]
MEKQKLQRRQEPKLLNRKNEKRYEGVLKAPGGWKLRNSRCKLQVKDATMAILITGRLDVTFDKESLM